jgi:hypothetical protein
MHFSLLTSILALASISRTHAAPRDISTFSTLNLEKQFPDIIIGEKDGETPRQKRRRLSGNAFRVSAAVAGVGAASTIAGTALAAGGSLAAATGAGVATVAAIGNLAHRPRQGPHALPSAASDVPSVDSGEAPRKFINGVVAGETDREKTRRVTGNVFRASAAVAGLGATSAMVGTGIVATGSVAAASGAVLAATSAITNLANRSPRSPSIGH